MSSIPYVVCTLCHLYHMSRNEPKGVLIWTDLSGRLSVYELDVNQSVYKKYVNNKSVGLSCKLTTRVKCRIFICLTFPTMEPHNQLVMLTDNNSDSSAIDILSVLNK